METLACKYYFTHKSGRKIIAQTSEEFFHMQGHKSEKVPEYLKTGKDGEFEAHHWGGNSYYRLGYKEWRNNPGKEQYEIEERANKFWSQCIGYEKIYQSVDIGSKRYSPLYLGYFGCALSNFLKNVHNHAIMMGDKETCDRVRKSFPQNKNILCLPPSK